MIKGIIVAQVTEALIEDGIKLMRQIIGSYFDATCYSISQPAEGSVWIMYLDGNHYLQNGQVLSMFYHPTKRHTATTVGKLGQKQSVAGPGQWAYSNQTKGAYGNKAYYNIL
ncbi:unnamed protein product (macronuclear) [Paramecium tetraurelia]|uniref:Uncharacterized protein n=1 Tax=Paramecium tetraurelia TaxID=5888 RepID=A0E1Z8_PARTE|nr:uncharacterized protein GSPATT00022486001 [Paramecium tetraurelia]CAK89315.1 unnamed protein product [Paramecium tetraurelia]|eukprot:XP_001456712.1 hypothetical protein (macronuclear) [Paramecium tetraurelia strain d4-2]